MTTFITLTIAGTNRPIAINVAQIIDLYPSTENGGHTAITTTETNEEGCTTWVNESMDDILVALSLAANVVKVAA